MKAEYGSSEWLEELKQNIEAMRDHQRTHHGEDDRSVYVLEEVLEWLNEEKSKITVRYLKDGKWVNDEKSSS